MSDIYLNSWMNSSVCCSDAKLCPTLCDPMGFSTPSSHALPYFPRFAQTHVRCQWCCLYSIGLYFHHQSHPQLSILSPFGPATWFFLELLVITLQDWRRSVFIPIPKKGNAKECSNYCTIALISHASKVRLKFSKPGFSKCEPWTSWCSSWF